MSELEEQLEHAAHNAQHGDPQTRHLSRYVGITMAILGALLAFSSALGGGERTQLITTMVQQTNTSMKYQAISTKYRVLLAQLRQLHSLNPDPARFNEWEELSKKLRGEISQGDLARLARIVRLENAKNLDAEIPTHDDMAGFASAIQAMEKEKDSALEWTESYDPAVEAHSVAAEHYEWAQLAAEIGIVIASLALLFTSRPAWYAAVALGTSTIVIVAVTFVLSTGQLRSAEAKIQTAGAHFESLNSEKNGQAADDDLLKSAEEEKSVVVDPEH